MVGGTLAVQDPQPFAPNSAHESDLGQMSMQL